MSRSHGRGPSQKNSYFAQNLETFMRKQKNMHFKLFYHFILIYHTHWKIFSDFFVPFLAQNFKTEVLTTQKNLLLEFCNVHMCVSVSICLCVCLLLRYRLNIFLPPLPEIGCPNFLKIQNPWGKVMERRSLRFEKFYL